ncbi:hypothetical protein BBR47_36480 [Brevibacillus brevis NBRC 100599]|uniref:Uncharacterized protein n=1 Tax=Brevibacillus brevis (strain 47 / JCM 6285 / NBRC 100599) TaxID=358681 RepID=C0ZFR6_BREBN|nr:hypothetical protein BBR47_36480 [Brevibacillus brevis NBRC 100599]
MECNIGGSKEQYILCERRVSNSIDRFLEKIKEIRETLNGDLCIIIENEGKEFWIPTYEE